MNKGIKSIVLAFVLFSPAAVYLFLQGFGENKFDIPVYYEQGLDTLTSCGQVMQIGEYSAILPSALDVETEEQEGILLDLGILAQTENRSAKNNLLSYLSKYQDESRIKTLALYSSDSLAGQLTDFPNLSYVWLSAQDFTIFAECKLVANPDEKNGFYPLVLIDKQRRIRGYYDATDLEEIDRLNTEVYILLNE